MTWLRAPGSNGGLSRKKSARHRQTYEEQSLPRGLHFVLRKSVWFDSSSRCDGETSLCRWFAHGPGGGQLP